MIKRSLRREAAVPPLKLAEPGNGHVLPVRHGVCDSRENRVDHIANVIDCQIFDLLTALLICPILDSVDELWLT